MRLYFDKLALWLAILWACLLPALALTPAAPKGCVGEIFSAGYDVASTKIAFGYDSPLRPTCAYDELQNYVTGEGNRAVNGTHSSFGQATEIKAAEGTANTPLALGLKDAGLEGFAQARGATIATGENWQTTVLDALNDPNTTVHFNLDGVDVWPGVQRAATGVEGEFGPTDWELLQIKQNPQSWDTLQFWKDGQPAPDPFK